jgi:hypothetical protein
MVSGGEIMEKTIMKYLVIIQFFGVCALIFNHFLRDLTWLPLVWLLIPSMLLVIVFGDDDVR